MSRHPSHSTMQPSTLARARTVALRRARLKRELIVVGVLFVVSVLVSHHFDVFEHLTAWTSKYQRYAVDELVIGFVWFTIYAAVFGYRALSELTVEVQQRESVEQHLRDSETRLSKLFTSSPHPMFVVSLDSGYVIDANEEFERAFKFRRTEVIGRTEKTLGLWATPDFDTALRQLLRRDGRVRNVEVLVRSGADETYTALVSAEILETGGEPTIVVALNDISHRKQLEEQLAHQALHDPLTGLPNRALFRDRVEHAIARAARQNRSPAVLFLDLDDFKRVNDALGHAVGDQLLRVVTQRLGTCLRTSDTCARLGGDEFAILLEDAASADDAVRLAERIIPLFRAPFALEDAIARVGGSIGIAVVEPGTSADELLRNADLAMYLSKSAGKGRFTVFEPSMHAEVLQRVALESDLRVALEQEQFTLQYQPIVSIAGAEILGIEALLRWNHPQRGVIGPAEFIPIAEESGTIIEIGRWVLHEACRQCRALDDLHPHRKPLTLAVNLSGRQIASPLLIDHVSEALGASGLSPSQLVLEITESVLVHNDRATLERLWDLKRLGVRLAIDDFGTGYSSLAYLQQFPVDMLKIDKSFTDRLGSGAEESPLSRAVIGLGSTLSVQTIAEGIETHAQWDRLRDLGCELGQGYLFARPMAIEGVEGLLARGGFSEPERADDPSRKREALAL